MGSSWTRDGTRVSCVARQILDSLSHQGSPNSYFLTIALLLYDSHTVQFAPLECMILLFLECAQILEPPLPSDFRESPSPRRPWRLVHALLSASPLLPALSYQGCVLNISLFWILRTEPPSMSGMTGPSHPELSSRFIHVVVGVSASLLPWPSSVPVCVRLPDF